MTPISTKNTVTPRNTRASVFIMSRRLSAVSARSAFGSVVLGLVQVPHRALGADRRERVEVVLGRRRRGGPLERLAIPRDRDPAGSPLRNVTNRFQRNASTPIAITKEPIVEIRFSVPHPSAFV